MAGEEAQHLGLGAQPALGVGKRGAADAVDAQALADAGEDVDQAAARAVVHHRLGGGDERQAELGGEAGGAGDARRVLAVVARAGDEVGVRVAAGEAAGAGQPGAQAAAGRRVQQQMEVVELDEVGGVEQALALLGPPGAEGEQAAEPGPAGAVARQRGDLEPVGEAEAGGGDEAGDGGAAAGGLLELLVGAHEPRDRVAVGDGEGGQAELDRAQRIFLRVAAPGQEGEVRGDRELGEGHGQASR